METTFTVVIWIGLALVCMVMAERRGRDKTLGFVSGLFFGIFSVIYYAIVGDTKEMKEAKLEEAIKRVDRRRQIK